MSFPPTHLPVCRDAEELVQRMCTPAWGINHARPCCPPNPPACRYAEELVLRKANETVEDPRQRQEASRACLAGRAWRWLAAGAGV